MPRYVRSWLKRTKSEEARNAERAPSKSANTEEFKCAPLRFRKPHDALRSVAHSRPLRCDCRSLADQVDRNLPRGRMRRNGHAIKQERTGRGNHPARPPPRPMTARTRQKVEVGSGWQAGQPPSAPFQACRAGRTPARWKRGSGRVAYIQPPRPPSVTQCVQCGEDGTARYLHG
jgi:hypothetical protein